MVLATLFFSRGTSLLLLTPCVYWQPALQHPEGEAYIKVLSLPITQYIPIYHTLVVIIRELLYVRPQSNIPAHKLSTVGETWRRWPTVFRRSSFTMIWCLLRLPYQLCQLKKIASYAYCNAQFFSKLMAKITLTRFKLYHLSSKHKIICNRNYFSSEALLVLYLPLVCFRLGSLLTGAGDGSGNEMASCNLHIRDEEQYSSPCMNKLLDAILLPAYVGKYPVNRLSSGV